MNRLAYNIDVDPAVLPFADVPENHIINLDQYYYNGLLHKPNQHIVNLDQYYYNGLLPMDFNGIAGGQAPGGQPGQHSAPPVTIDPTLDDGRECRLVLATGTKRVGKSFTTLCKIEDYIRDIPEIGQRGRKVLIYDVNKEYSPANMAKHGRFRGRPFNYNIPSLPINRVLDYTMQNRAEVRRILPYDEKGYECDRSGIIKNLNIILRDFKGGMLLLEDINGYLIGAPTQDIISTLTRNAHKDLDIYIHLQSLAKVDPTMFQNADYIRYHKQMDDAHRYLNRIPSPEKYMIAEKLVNIMYPKNKRFYCYIENKLHKISGKFSLFDYQVAVYSYLLDNTVMVKKQIARSEFMPGGKISHEEAMKRAIKEKMQYFGNPWPKAAA